MNHDPVMTLTKFMARSTWVAYAFELGKLLTCHLKGKASRKLANGQNIDYSEKRKWPKGYICPCTGVKYHNIQTCLLVYAADLRRAFTGPLVLWSQLFQEKLLICNPKCCDTIHSNVFHHSSLQNNNFRLPKKNVINESHWQTRQISLHRCNKIS